MTKAKEERIRSLATIEFWTKREFDTRRMADIPILRMDQELAYLEMCVAEARWKEAQRILQKAIETPDDEEGAG